MATADDELGKRLSISSIGKTYMLSKMPTFPVPGGPHKIRLGILPSSAIALSRTNVSSLPTTSSSVRGRYRSTQGTSYPPPPLPAFFRLEEEVEDEDVAVAGVLIEFRG